MSMREEVVALSILLLTKYWMTMSPLPGPSSQTSDVDGEKGDGYKEDLRNMPRVHQKHTEAVRRATQLSKRSRYTG